MKLNSVIFHSPNISSLRDFYEGKLNLPTGTYEKDGVEVSDLSDNYVNYHISGGLLCFENEGDRLDLGTVVINVEDFEKFQLSLKDHGVVILAGNEHWFKIKDPDGRTLIFEPAQ